MCHLRGLVCERSTKKDTARTILILATNSTFHRNTRRARCPAAARAREPAPASPSSLRLDARTGYASPPSCRRPHRRGATLRRSLSESATASPIAIFVGRDGRTKPLGAERRLTPLAAELGIAPNRASRVLDGPRGSARRLQLAALGLLGASPAMRVRHLGVHDEPGRVVMREME